MTLAVLSGLRRIDPREAALRREAITALTGRRVGDAVLVARFPAADASSGGWLTCTNGAALAVDRVEGVACRLDAADGLAAADTLERIEPLLREVEQALGIELEPSVIVAAPPEDAPILTIDAMTAGRVAATLRLAIPAAVTLAPAPATLAFELIRRGHVAVSITLDGPRLSPHIAAGLGTGDLVLLGKAPLTARLQIGDRARAAGDFDPSTRQFTCRTIS